MVTVQDPRGNGKRIISTKIISTMVEARSKLTPNNRIHKCYHDETPNKPCVIIV